MVTYALSADGLPNYNATGRNLIEVGGNVYDLDGHRIWHFDGVRREPLTGREHDAPGVLSTSPLLFEDVSFSCPSAARDLLLQPVEPFDLQ